MKQIEAFYESDQEGRFDGRDSIHFQRAIQAYEQCPEARLGGASIQ